MTCFFLRMYAIKSGTNITVDHSRHSIWSILPVCFVVQ